MNMNIRIERILLALMFALVFAGATFLIADAQDGTPPPANNVTYENCMGCHKDVQDTWQNGPHGHAMSDPVFAQAWNAQGKPGACLVCHSTEYDPATGQSQSEGVNCASCHSPIPANHPVDNMPVDTSPDLCGKCHSDPRFSTDNWKLSTHYQRGMECVVCHDAHTAGMKTVAGTASITSGDASALCENCHKVAMQNFPTSKHAEAGVTCVNCHLGFNVGNQEPVDFGTAHKAPDHSFLPSLDTCNKCHANQMHAPGQAVAAAAIKAEELGGTPTPEPSPVVSAVPPTTNEPSPISPFGFAAMASVVGVAIGMVLAPWLERAYRHLSKGDKNEQ
jgi:predicted CXXCH cytochrome family protein